MNSALHHKEDTDIMKTLVSIFALSLALALVMGCGPEVEVETSASASASSSSSSSGEGGIGGSGGATVSSSSSSSSGQLMCDIVKQAEFCEECKAVGCAWPTTEAYPDPCDYGAAVTYSDMIGCLQWPAPQANCPACKDIKAGMPITFECQACAQPFTPCSLYCYQALGGTP